MSAVNHLSKTYLISPNFMGEDRRSYPISKINFSPKVAGNFKGNRPYLVIGFDTEYQRVTNPFDADLIEENEVLSYQYHCMIVEDHNLGSETNWNGIIIPESGKVADRLTLTEFVSFALGDGLNQYSKIRIPRDLYLVAHFTRADIPGFKDFKDDSKNTRSNLNLDNVRNVFINVKQDIPVTLYDDEFRECVELSVRIRDTLTLAPTGKGKLENLGEVLGFKKLQLSQDPEEELNLKRNMKAFMESNWAMFREYAIRDAEVCARYTAKMIHLYHEHTGKFKLPITLSQIGVDLIRKYWLNKGIDPYEVVGKEQVVERYYSKKYNRYIRTKKDTEKKKLFYNANFLTECYHGGRNEQFWFGPSYESIWYDYDLSSAYPSAMTLIGRPVWNDIRELRDTDELLQERDNKTKFTPADLVFAEVEFKFNEDVRFPCLPVRTETGLIFPREGFASTHISEIRLAQRLGCQIFLKHGLKIGGERHGYSKGMERPFRGFTTRCIEERKKHPKGSLENLFWKELVNSTYGKTAQGLRERRIYDLRDKTTKKLEQSKITNPVYASFITAFCRGTLSEIMNNLPQDVDIFSVTTDGFLTTATPKQMEKATQGILSRYYKSSRRILSDTEKIYEVKHIIKRPLGWRTRGQATITQSNETDWRLAESPVEAKKENNRCVLAKGGIKLSTLLSKREENDQILKLFLERDPNQKLALKLGVGIRDMYENGWDFIDKDVLKRLSMEFDWKRRPHYVGETNIKLPNINCEKHLFFSTKPWKNLNEYTQIRSIWEDYNKEKYQVLKSLEQYQSFKEYFEGRLSVMNKENEAAGSYLSKENGPLKRLRQQIIIAQKVGKGGCHKLKYQAMGNKAVFPTSKLKAKDFAEMLTTLLKIPVSKSDVTNGRKGRNEFSPNSVPRTSTTYRTLVRIKEKLFPDLDISQFLTTRGDFDIESCDLADCKFSQKMGAFI